MKGKEPAGREQTGMSCELDLALQGIDTVPAAVSIHLLIMQNVSHRRHAKAESTVPEPCLLEQQSSAQAPFHPEHQISGLDSILLGRAGSPLNRNLKRFLLYSKPLIDGTELVFATRHGCRMWKRCSCAETRPRTQTGSRTDARQTRPTASPCKC